MLHMQEIPVRARKLRSVAYENALLQARLKNGLVYRHRGVPRVLFEALLAAAHPDAWYDRHIRKYPYTRRFS